MPLAGKIGWGGGDRWDACGGGGDCRGLVVEWEKLARCGAKIALDDPTVGHYTKRHCPLAEVAESADALA